MHAQQGRLHVHASGPLAPAAVGPTHTPLKWVAFCNASMCRTGEGCQRCLRKERTNPPCKRRKSENSP
eukprot:363880-Chlamydomonas_euryale.AAC.9